MGHLVQDTILKEKVAVESLRHNYFNVHLVLYFFSYSI